MALPLIHYQVKSRRFKTLLADGENYQKGFYIIAPPL